MKIMRVFVRPRSIAEAKRHPRASEHRPQAKALAPGFQPTPQHDLKFRGGRTIAHLAFTNFFVGGVAAWQKSDMDNINRALAAAMSDPKLNNVMAQYFGNQAITTSFLGAHVLDVKKPKKVTETSAKQMITNLFNGGQLSGISLPSTVVNVMLPSGTVLTDGTGPGKDGDDADDDKPAKPGTPEAEEASSLEGLGGYHGSVDIGSQRVYYAVGVYSERLANGKENGIPVFDQSWKNIVATFYHELNEARTDPDVDDAIKTGKIDNIIGWNSEDGEECGDFPVFEAGDAGDLGLVFKEVAVQQSGTAPVQFQYSNAVHGPEGPIAAPHTTHAHQMT
ncbi:MAG TPA: hypothetical protein VFA27_16105 [Vicinamibacterales bacterium]|nr:hypothetical protein [Vicinamibacterales bacterium]